MEKKILKLLAQAKHSPHQLRYVDLQRICQYYFGKPRQNSGSHCIYRTPWAGDPRINIQNHKGMAKAYQVKQVLQAIYKLEQINEQSQ